MAVVLLVGLPACASEAGGTDAAVREATVVDLGVDIARLDGGGGDGGPSSCAFDDSYFFGVEGGLAPFRDQASLVPPGTYLRQRDFGASQPAVSCMVPVPVCGTADQVDIGEMNEALGQADVRTLLTPGKSTVFGVDPRPYDGQAWVVRKGADRQGGEIVVGAPCSGGAGCTEPPPNVRTLRARFEALEAQALANPACAGLRR
jgi:hypothetical protein